MAGEFLPANGFDTYETQDKVLVGMSGGVDSSVTVRILQQQGFYVQGAVIRFSDAHQKAVDAALEAAEQLGVECMVLDVAELFEQEVITPFCESYCKGETPNPCVLCNPTVKFTALLAAADKLNFAYIATGHYARVETDNNGISHICLPESTARDQSYMLGRLGQNVLSRLLLPLGEFQKDDVRELATEFNLSCANAPDSMEICFIPDNDYAGYIKARGLAGKDGRFLSPEGKDLGAHKGVLHYTVGQRKGLGIALGKPAFVREICENGNIQLAYAGDEYFSTIQIRDLASANGEVLPQGEYLIKIRSAATPSPCYFDGDATITMPEPIRAPAPGQSAVFYHADAVLGSAFIVKAF
ncbi:MAG: tRNA 2-thiouridine(34) synthase MnmA [Faecalibacterium sp.]